MELIIEKIFNKSKSKIYLLDILIVAAIYYIPTFSHLLSLPLYYVEPMRLALVVSILFTNRTNAYLIALTLPAFSYIISSHPVLIKTMLISSELLLNVFLFYYLKDRLANATLVFVISIIAAKLYYYVVKFFMLYFAALQGSLVSTPIMIQVAMLTVFSAFFYFLYKKENL
ncbi:MAG: hypothetical protein KJ571_03225 [Bacteroidetes bacterium]|nr:hypothetical protein [Bacteroidota bacterium]